MSLHNVYKSYQTPDGKKTIAQDINVCFRSKTTVGVLGRNGAGKSTLLKMICGTIRPDQGRVNRVGSVSWPVGFGGSFHPDLTGVQNVKFVARIHGVDARELVEFVQEFSELGAHFNMPFRTYSSGMRSRLAFGVSMGISFDTYLVDEITAVGDASFREKSVSLFQSRLDNAGAIVVSHSMPLIREICDAVAVLEGGELELFEDVQDGIDRHLEIMAVHPHL